MFSLIITIISIALVAALAVATIYYGGDAFNQGSSKAKASTIVNQAQQIAGANTLYKSATGGFTDVMSTLTSTPNAYLASAPTSNDVNGYTISTTNRITATVQGAGANEICSKITEIAAGSTQFGCTGNAFFFQG